MPSTDGTNPLLDRICERCELSFGAHRGDSICRDQCPQHEGRMDYPDTDITTFVDSGRLAKVPRDTPSKRFPDA